MLCQHFSYYHITSVEHGICQTVGMFRYWTLLKVLNKSNILHTFSLLLHMKKHEAQLMLTKTFQQDLRCQTRLKYSRKIVVQARWKIPWKGLFWWYFPEAVKNCSRRRQSGIEEKDSCSESKYIKTMSRYNRLSNIIVRHSQ